MTTSERQVLLQKRNIEDDLIDVYPTIPFRDGGILKAYPCASYEVIIRPMILGREDIKVHIRDDHDASSCNMERIVDVTRLIIKRGYWRRVDLDPRNILVRGCLPDFKIRFPFLRGQALPCPCPMFLKINFPTNMTSDTRETKVFIFKHVSV